MSLTNKLSTFINNISDTDPRWRIFIEDYRDYILANSKIVFLTPYLKEVFRYRLDHFLSENKISPELQWIIVWLNDLISSNYFDGVDFLIVPELTYIKQLRSKFDSLPKTG